MAARLGNAGGVTVGLGEGETFVASDIPAILEHTQRVIHLDSREMAVVTAEGAASCAWMAAPIKKRIHHPLGSGIGRQGRVSPLYAKRNPRASGGDHRHHPRAGGL